MSALNFIVNNDSLIMACDSLIIERDTRTWEFTREVSTNESKIIKDDDFNYYLGYTGDTKILNIIRKILLFKNIKDIDDLKFVQDIKHEFKLTCDSTIYIMGYSNALKKFICYKLEYSKEGMVNIKQYEENFSLYPYFFINEAKIGKTTYDITAPLLKFCIDTVLSENNFKLTCKFMEWIMLNQREKNRIENDGNNTIGGKFKVMQIKNNEYKEYEIEADDNRKQKLEAYIYKHLFLKQKKKIINFLIEKIGDERENISDIEKIY